MIRYKCPQCGATLESPRELGGKQDTCPICQRRCAVPLTRSQKAAREAENRRKAERGRQDAEEERQQREQAAEPLHQQQAARRKEAERVVAQARDPSFPLSRQAIPVDGQRGKTGRRHLVIGLTSAAAVMLLVPLLIYSVNYIGLQAKMNGILAEPVNRGIKVSVHYGHYVDGDTLVYDLRSVPTDKSIADVFRVFLRFAERMQAKEFDSVELCFRGDERFRVEGEYFRQLGREISQQNPISTIRTFPEHLRTPTGSSAFHRRTGGWLYVLGKQIEDFHEFHRRWYLADLIREADLGSYADKLRELKPSPGGSASGSPPPVAPESSDFKIISIRTRVTESNELWWKYAWKLTLRSRCNRSLALEVEIKFLDQDGFIVDTDLAYDLFLRPHEERDFTGAALLRAAVAPKVAKTEAIVRPR